MELALIIGAFLVIGVILVIVDHENEQKNERKAQLEKIDKIEQQRGDAVRFILLPILAEDRPRLGIPDTIDSQYLFLVSQRDGMVHFAYTNSPSLKLTNIDFQAQFQQHTTGQVSGASGTAILGGALFGDVGATIGAAAPRSMNTVTKNEEVASRAMLTFEKQIGGGQTLVEVGLTTDSYHALQKYFVYREASPLIDSSSTKPQATKHADAQPKQTKSNVLQSNQDIIETLEALLHLREKGIINEQEYAEKKKMLLSE